MNRLYCRAYQGAFKAASAFLPWRRPEILGGNAELAAKIKAANVSKALIVTGKHISALGLPDRLKAELTKSGIDYEVFSGTQQNPTIDNVESALALYKVKRCDGIIAFGGGSPMDCAKAVGARVARPDRTVEQMRGQLKVGKKLPFLAAVPTTAGTGSETSVSAVVVNGDTHEKFAINDPALIPAYALLDPELTAGLPPNVTAQTGLDALVHAVEAYIGRGNTKQTRLDAERAAFLIFRNLPRAYADGSDIEARRNMQEAAFLAGAAFTRAYVGNIHALSHALSGLYGVPHGLTNAVIMPYVLEDYGSAIDAPGAALAAAAGVGNTAGDLLDAIKKLNAGLKIPEGIEELRSGDVTMLAARAEREANPLYPVPVIYSVADMERIYGKLL